MINNENDEIFCYQNRELSWLKFNERILEEVSDASVPILERLKFLSIFTSNLDEFFMIRVGSLFDLMEINKSKKDSRSGLTAESQLDLIYKYVKLLYEKKKQIYLEVKQELEHQDIYSLKFNELTNNELKFVRDYFKKKIKPVLSPQIVDAHHPFPHMINKEIYIVAVLKGKDGEKFGVLPIPSILEDTVFLPGVTINFLKIEYILLAYMQELFEPYEVLEKNCICVTRNADITINDPMLEDLEDFRSKMKKLLNKRGRLQAVRLEANYEMSDRMENYLCTKLNIASKQVFVSPTSMKMEYVFDIFAKLSISQKHKIAYLPIKPAASVDVDVSNSIISQILERDVLLHYPFQSMDVFLNLIKESAYDPRVLSIKITIYRLAKNAKLVDYLCLAAENGKEVLVIMELRARFDEKNNIDWSERLESSGCKVVYGFEEYKTHSKICLITFKDKENIFNIVQVGTGNYNEQTAKLYTDLCLITANKNLSLDADKFFKNMLVGDLSNVYTHLLVAPKGLKTTLLNLIQEEINRGSEGLIRIKINSLTDVDFLEKLVEASRAGVKVQLIVRGICCLLPMIDGATENVEVISIVGRFLEHSRIYCFGRGSNEKIFISSADLMTRNTECRVEIACPILEETLKQSIRMIMDTQFADSEKSRKLMNNGDYTRVEKIEKLNSQEFFLDYYANLKKVVAKTERKTILEKIKSFFSKN